MAVKVLKWIGPLLIVVVYAWTWVEIYPEDADLPPVPSALFLLMLCVGTAYAWKFDRERRDK